MHLQGCLYWILVRGNSFDSSLNWLYLQAYFYSLIPQGTISSVENFFLQYFLFSNWPSSAITKKDMSKPQRSTVALNIGNKFSQNLFVEEILLIVNIRNREKIDVWVVRWCNNFFCILIAVLPKKSRKNICNQTWPSHFYMNLRISGTWWRIYKTWNLQFFVVFQGCMTVSTPVHWQSIHFFYYHLVCNISGLTNNFYPK